MLVSACREIVSATSAVLCGVFVCVAYVFMCERSSSSFRPFPLHYLLLAFLILLFPFFSYPVIIAGDYLENPNDLLRLINLRESCWHDARISLSLSLENFFSDKSHSNVQVYFCFCKKENFASLYIFQRICLQFNVQIFIFVIPSRKHERSLLYPQLKKNLVK